MDFQGISSSGEKGPSWRRKVPDDGLPSRPHSSILYPSPNIASHLHFAITFHCGPRSHCLSGAPTFTRTPSLLVLVLDRWETLKHFLANFYWLGCAEPKPNKKPFAPGHGFLSRTLGTWHAPGTLVVVVLPQEIGKTKYSTKEL